MNTTESAYVAKPTQNGPAVIVVHDWYGRLPHVLTLCDRLAESGFTAAAPDLYDGRATTDPASAEEYMTALDEVQGTARLLDAIRSLPSWDRARNRRVGAIGFSMGGAFVTAAARAQLLDCAVLYYASLDGGAEYIMCPVLGHLAEIDDWDPPDAPQQSFEQLRARGIPSEYHVYPSTEHSFANRDVSFWHKEAAEEAWERTVEFLMSHLDPRKE